MMNSKGLLLLVFLLSGMLAFSQRIVYSEPSRDDTRRMNFEIAGKIGNNFLIYKNVRSNNWISVLDNDMVEIGKQNLDFIPDNERLINMDIFSYPEFCYLIYQYQRKGIVYCEAARVNGEGKKVGEVMLLDTTRIGYTANNKIYTVLASEDKSKIIVFKINSKNKRMYQISSRLLSDRLDLIKESRLTLPMEDKDDYLGEFNLDNDGDLIFTRFDRVNSENIGNAAFVIKKAMEDSFHVHPLTTEKMYLDEIKIKPDNFNKRYFLTSFYNKQRRGNIDGFYFYIWDKVNDRVVIERMLEFSDELRKEARGNASTKAAFNDYFIRNIITRRDGGFIIGAESYYTTSRGNAWNRWNYFGSPYMRPYDYYYYSPYYNNYWGNRWNDRGSVRYQADNIVVFSFDSTGAPEWNNVIAKEQYDDQSDDLLSYQLFVTGGQLHFLFNVIESRRQILNDFAVSPDGEIKKSPTLKNLDRGHDFMPKYAKQVSARQMIVPCQYRNYISFAKIDFN
ncbi:hypothetical protein [Terrimonas ferruginea]|uniref:hypothetical protein n=1 Tax=Terrimonas ferruginea TaxID=249 RepID=UPI00041D7C2E|nr:hypothetical protein [Terrimonas ferruginea]